MLLACLLVSFLVSTSWFLWAREGRSPPRSDSPLRAWTDSTWRTGAACLLPFLLVLPGFSGQRRAGLHPVLIVPSGHGLTAHGGQMLLVSFHVSTSWFLWAREGRSPPRSDSPLRAWTDSTWRRGASTVARGPRLSGPWQILEIGDDESDDDDSGSE